MIPLMLLWLRATGLVGHTVALGSAVFALIVLSREPTQRPARALERALALAGIGALVVAFAQAALLAALAQALAVDDARSPMSALLRSTVGAAGLARIAVALVTAGAVVALRQAPASSVRRALLLGSSVLLAASGALGSHAMGRLDAQAPLLIVTALHQVAVAVWVGGLVCAGIVALRADSSASAWLRPFSTVALAAVAGIAVTGFALWFTYVGAAAAAVGTSYGAMVLTKIVLFVALLTMGALNHRALHGRLTLAPWRTSGAAEGDPALVRRRLEVEAGLAVVTILLAASIGSAPPAAAVGNQRATWSEIRAVVFTPKWPRLSSPTLAELAAASDLGDPNAPRTAEDTAWSEFGHNVAGLFVVAMGILATLERLGMRWARHWPLLITVLAGFVALNIDPEGWQTGTVGFWEHLLSPEVVQHRILLILTALFGFAEWRARNGHNPNSHWNYVFPLVAIWSGILLLAHAHELSDSKSAFFMEISHLAMGLVSLLVGWSRWLELRLPPAVRAWPGRIWAPALAVFGLLLVLYREV